MYYSFQNNTDRVVFVVLYVVGYTYFIAEGPSGVCETDGLSELKISDFITYFYYGVY